MTNFPIITPRRNTTNRRMIDGISVPGDDEPLATLWSALPALALLGLAAAVVAVLEDAVFEGAAEEAEDAPDDVGLGAVAGSDER